MQVDENKPIVEVSNKMDVIEKERESAGNKKENGDDAGLKKESGDGGVQIIGNEDNSLQGKIIRFVEFLFGDYNLPRDRFLKKQVLVDDGWVALDTVIKYDRLAHLTTRASVVIEALKKATSGLIEVCEESRRVRRSKEKPLPDETPERALEIKNRTVYCKGFPRDDLDFDRIFDFFSQYRTVEDFQRRCFANKHGHPVFKGSVTATFRTREQAEKFMSQNVVKYNAYPLARQWCADWEVEKAAENEELEALEDFMRGSIMKLVGVPDGTDHNKVVEALSSTSAEVCGVDFLPNHTAHVLLHNDAKSVLGELENGKVTIDDVSVEASVLEGEEEKEALKKVEDRMNSDDDSDDDCDEDEAGDDSDQSPEDEAGDDSDLSYEEETSDDSDPSSEDEADDDSDPSSEDQSATPDAENVMQEPSAATGEKRQGSSEPGNPAKKARDD